MKIHKKVASWILDYAYMTRGALVMMYHKNPPAHYLGYTVDGKVPVILIPGIMGRWGFMKRLGDSISFLGHPVYVLPKLGNNMGNIPETAKNLSATIESIFKEQTTKPLGAIIVAHSKGGLIGKYFLSHYNDKKHPVGMIAIATPFSGSSLGSFLPIDAVQELGIKSPVIADLKSHAETNDRIISLIPEYDNHVWAKSGSTLTGAENIALDVRGHHKVIFSEHTIVQVCKSIELLTKKLFTK
jgi:pimeloyl-ACP methyl ester carboxylesterase